MSNDIGPADRRRRRLLKALAAAGASVSIAGCGGDGDSTPTDEDGTPDGDGTPTSTGTPEPLSEGPGDSEFIMGTTSPAQNISPLSTGDEVTANRLDLLYDTGGIINTDIEFEGRLLEDWELSEDGQTVTYTVRDGLEFGAGYGQLTAEDYVYCANNVFSAGWAQLAQASYFFLGGEKISYEQTDELTFEASLPQPRVNWLHEDPLIYLIPVPMELAQKYNPDDSAGTPEVTATGTGELSPREAFDRDSDVVNAAISGNLGPFNYVEYDKGNRLTVEANPDYYLADTDVAGGKFQGAPMTDSYEYQVFDEATTGYSALEAGDITGMGIEARKYSDITSPDDVKRWHSQYGTGIFWLNLNHRVNGWAPIRESREVRQAMAHLIEKDNLINQIYDGFANPVDTFHPRWGPYYDDSQIETFETSVDQARTKLEEGTSSDYGYSGDQFVGPDGEQVELKLVFVNTSQSGEIIQNYLSNRFGEVGISITTDGLPFGDILSTYLSNSVDNNPNYSGEPDYGPISGYNGGPWDQSISSERWDILYGVGFSHGAYSPWSSIGGVLRTEGSFNFLGYSAEDMDMDARIQEAASAESQEETSQVLTDIFGYISREQPLIWAFNDHSTIGYRSHVTGLPGVENAFSAPNDRLIGLTGQ